VLSLLLEQCDATKKATMKTTEFAISNPTYNVIVVYGRIDVRKSFSIIQFGGIYIISIVQQEWKNFSANYTIILDTLPSFLIDSNVSLKCKQQKSNELGDTFPGSQHFRGRGACWSFRMGLGRMTST
jgi:hypothetical protein